jgi:hypothetical protein
VRQQFLLDLGHSLTPGCRDHSKTDFFNGIEQIPPSDLEGLPTALGSIAEIQTEDTDKKSGGLSRRSR